MMYLQSEEHLLNLVALYTGICKSFHRFEKFVSFNDAGVQF